MIEGDPDQRHTPIEDAFGLLSGTFLASLGLFLLHSTGVVSAFAYLHPLMLPGLRIDPIYACLVGNLLAGVGMLILFRHRSSLGGFNTVALLAQERLGWSAGYVQLGFDATVILCSLTIVAWPTVVLSTLGTGVLSIVLALNHRPGRYLGY